MKAGINLLALCICVLSTGCASVSGGNVQKMYVRTQTPSGTAVSDAECILSNDKGSWRVKSPGDTSIVRSNKPMEIKCDKATLQQGTAIVESGTRAAMFGNFLAGGVVGAVIDHSSGAAYEYVEIINIIMGKLIAIAAPAAPNSKQAKLTPSPVVKAATVSAPVPESVSAVPTPTPAKSSPSPAMKAVAVSTPVPEPVPATPPVPDWTPNQELRAAHPPTQFALLTDAQAVPSVSSSCRGRYEAWLTHANPRAFAVGPKGNCGFSWGVRPPATADGDLPKDPAERALIACTRQGQGACKLYAIDDHVVWTSPAGNK